MSDATEDIQARDMQRLNAAVASLREHFESVQILVTRHDPEMGGTIEASVGSGNWHARTGQARAWLQSDDARQIAYAIRSDGTT